MVNSSCSALDGNRTRFEASPSRRSLGHRAPRAKTSIESFAIESIENLGGLVEKFLDLVRAMPDPPRESFTAFLWGHTGRSLLDIWSVVHFCFWVFIGSSIHPFVGPKFPGWMALGICVVLSFVWEIVERFPESTQKSLWMHPESWVNAFISDPAMCVLGVVFIFYAMDHWRFS